MRILLVDNYDSFSYNIKNFLEICFRLPVEIFRNDDDSLLGIDVCKYFLLVLSPGPKSPRESGYCFDLMNQFIVSEKSILGICLGMQIINEFFGGKTKKSHFPQHGFNSLVEYKEDVIYNEMINPLEVMRYNSLYCVVKDSNLIVNSFLVNNVKEAMSIRHKTKKILAFQYHPESFLSFNSKKNKNQFIKNLKNFFLQ